MDTCKHGSGAKLPVRPAVAANVRFLKASRRIRYYNDLAHKAVKALVVYNTLDRLHILDGLFCNSLLISFV